MNYFSNKSNRSQSVFLLVVMVLMGLSFSAKSEEQSHQVLVISTMTDNPPYGMLTPEGEITGYYTEFWKLWAQVNQRKIRFVGGDFSESIEFIDNETADFHSGLFSNETRLKRYAFSLPIDSIDNGVFFLKSGKTISSLDELSGEKIAIHPEYDPIDYIRKNHPSLQLVLTRSPKVMIEKLVEGEVVGVIGEVPFIRTLVEKLGLQGIIGLAPHPVKKNNVFALTLKRNDSLITIINKGIKNIPKEQLIKLKKKWLPDSFEFNNDVSVNRFLTESDLDYLRNLNSLSVGIDPNWTPIEHFEDGEHRGISADYLKIIGKAISKRLVPDSIIPWKEVLKKIKRKELDILPAVIKRKNMKDFINFSQPYISISMAIAIRRNSIPIQSVNDLNNYRVGATKGSPIHDLLIENYPDLDLLLFESKYSGLNLLKDNEIDAFIGNLANITSRIRHEYPELEVASVLPDKLQIRIGVRKGLEPLIPIIDSIIDSISSEQREKIKNTWLSVNLVQGTSFFTYTIWGAPFLIGLLIIIFIVNRVNKELRKRIRERIKVENSLRHAKIKSQRANLEKQQFLSNMSHEIRTPLNALIGMAHLLHQTILSKEQGEYLETMNYSADTLLLLVNDIVDLSKVESGELELERKDFDLVRLLKNIESQTKNTLLNKNVTFDYSMDKNVPKDLIGDKNRIGQILTNLISNAIKFTNEGFIKLNVQLLFNFVNNESNSELGKGSNLVVLQIELSDTGIGMTELQSKGLFKAYSQAEKSTAREYGGTGLGLMISKKLCELMGGVIWVDSKIGEGSRFIFTLKLNTAAVQSKNIASKDEIMKTDVNINPDENHSVLNGKKILIVEDNLVNLTIAKKILNNHKMIVTTATDGQKGIDAVKNEQYDAVLMDIQMPNMDGYEATRYIRETMGLSELPIIALSANVMAQDKILSKASGMNEHLDKPINVDLLLSTLVKYIKHSEKY